MRFEGGIFDIDGVVLDTPHERAWREALEQLMAGPWRELAPTTTYAPDRFTSQVYQDYVAGKPREAGAKAALAYFAVPDADGSRTQQYAELKQSILERLAAAGDFHAFDDALRFLLEVKMAAVRLCAASSSKNADAFLRAISVGAFCAAQGLRYPFVTPQTTLLDLFDADVDGEDVARGKPAPDLFLSAAYALGYDPEQCFVVEDAPAGIEAAKAGGMFSIGVARHDDAALLHTAGADLVVERLDALSVATLLEDGSRPDASQLLERQVGTTYHETVPMDMLPWSPSDPAWLFSAGEYVPEREGQVEAELAIANGLFGTRASLEFPTTISQSRTFVAGLFDLPAGPVQTPVLLSAPDWLRLHLMIDEEPVSLTTGEILEEARELDIRQAIFVHRLRWRSPGRRILRLRTVRLASQAQRALGMQYAHIEVEQPATLTLEISHREAPAPSLHLAEREGASDIWRPLRGNSWLAMAHDASLQVARQALQPTITEKGQRWQWKAVPGEQAFFTRFMALSRGEDSPENQSHQSTTTPLQSILQSGIHALVDDHVRAWERRWAASDIVVVGDPAVQRALRFATYHLLAAANPQDERVSVAARGLTGDEYYGHVFWDTEIFLLPFYIYTWPEAARALLMYRCNMLDGARAKATRLGYRGAFYAWESADTGDEATPRGALGPDGREVVYPTATQGIHVSADVAYAIWNYWQATGDDDFLRDAGAEIILETARFYASRVSREADGSYHLRGVIGPDEYHEDVDDNAYTNGMAEWNLVRGLQVVEWLRQRWPDRWVQMQQQIQLTDEELQTWHDIKAHIVIGYDRARLRIEQFAGYSKLEYIDLATFKTPNPTIDLVLGQERTRRSQIIKQSDVLMLLALQWDRFTPDLREENFRYYAPRCSQGSSLSPATHALVAARLGDVETAERYFRQAAGIDEENTRRDGGAGVHVATQGGLWQAAVLGFAGLHPHANGLQFDPHLPTSWKELRFAIQWRGAQITVAFHNDTREMTAMLEDGSPITLGLGAQSTMLELGVLWSGKW